MLIKDLNGCWEFKRADSEEWIKATVPGSVYNDLLNAGLMDDPFYRDNEYKALELSNYDYEYKRDFVVEEGLLNHDRVLLLCEGLDTLATISVNNIKIAETDNMHRTYEFDIKSMLKVGGNSISIYFKSPVEYCSRKQEEYPLRNVDEAVPGISHIRKAHCMFGWDWGPKLPDMGIWRNISIQGYNNARLEDVYISQIHTGSEVSLKLDIQITKLKEGMINAKVEVEGPQGELFSELIANCSEKEVCMIDIENPKLWWPNNYGEQPLYSVRLVLEAGERIVDIKSYRIGLRTIKVARENDEWGQSFAFEVNGTKIFAMGADYIPEDNILARCNRNKTKKLIKDSAKANFNCIRVWGGGYYPEDYFYDLCDEYGLLVWQDLMYACGTYDLNEDFKENIFQETIDNMKRIRHHASLGLWCGNNEQEMAWVSWGWSEKFSLKLKADYIKQFEVLLPDIAEKVDPNTSYWLASPSSTGSFDRPNDENFGDMHFWEVWHGRKPFTAYREIYPRFMSEFGLQSFCGMKSIETFTLPEDRNIFSYVMESHQKNGTGNEKILYYIGENFKYPKDFNSLIYASQLIQAEGLRYGVEHWRRNRGRCMGAVYWQLNDCWPVASWSSIDYFGRWKALHYAAKRFFNPILASACEEGTKVSLHVSNEKPEKVEGILNWKLVSIKNGILAEENNQVEIPALSSKECKELEFSSYLDSIEKQRESYLEYSFLINGEVESTGTVMFVKAKHFNFENPLLLAECKENTDSFEIKIRANSFAKFVELDITEDDAVFSDNYFDMSANTVKHILVNKCDLSKEISFEEFKSQLRVRSYYNIF